MKKAIVLAVCLLVVCLLFGCTYYPDPSGLHINFSPDGTTSSIDFSARIIKYNDVEYAFKAIREDGKLNVTIYYPNGATYQSIGSNIVSSSNYDPKTYTPGETLVDLIAPRYAPVHKGPSGINIFALVFLVLFGVFGLFFPRAAWEFEHLFKSWQYYNHEPSDAGLMMVRIGGVIAILMGIVLFFTNWQ